MKKIFLMLSILLFISKTAAQQDPGYTQYMYNMNIINPAYATGKSSMLNLGSLYRTQWVGAVGSPKTITLFAHTQLNKKIEVGFSAISDDIGDGAKKENNFYADVAYVLPLAGQHKVSFGMKVGLTSIATNFNGFRLESGNTATDAAFSENINIVKPNIGVGAFYFTDKYYIGLSAPNLLPTNHISSRAGINANGTESIHAFLTAGYVFTLSESFKLKPAFMSKFVQNSPLNLDLTANVLYRDKFELGAAYRFGDAVSALMNVQATKNIKIGYAYDHTLSNLGKFNSGSHEIFILFNLDLLGKGYDKSPRFF